MPYYEFSCDSCGNETSDVLPVSRRNEPTEQPCSECGGKVRKCLGAPRLVYSPGDNIMAKTPDAFKDRLREIKKFAGKSSTIDV